MVSVGVKHHVCLLSAFRILCSRAFAPMSNAVDSAFRLLCALVLLATVDVGLLFRLFCFHDNADDGDDDELMLNVLRCHLTY